MKHNNGSLYCRLKEYTCPDTPRMNESIHAEILKSGDTPKVIYDGEFPRITSIPGEKIDNYINPDLLYMIIHEHPVPLMGILSGNTVQASLKSNRITDITSWFWKEYIAHGICMIDVLHKIEAPKRFAYTDTMQNRRCLWCGRYQYSESNNPKVWHNFHT